MDTTILMKLIQVHKKIERQQNVILIELKRYVVQFIRKEKQRKDLLSLS